MAESNALVSITLDETPMQLPRGTTIMQAAERLGVRIPRLCYHPDLSLAGSCRVCLVEVEGFEHFMASCSVQVWEGMVVRTNSPEIRRSRRDVVELLLDNHPRDCQTCERDGRCELQNLAYSMGIRERLFEGQRKRHAIESSSSAVVRDSEKCVLCGRCVRVCAEVQGVYNLSQHGRGFHTIVTPAHQADMDDSVCIQCGQCINVCPTAAFLEKWNTSQVWKALADPELHVVVQTAPSIRAALGESFGMPPGTPCTGKMVHALRLLGFDRVFDTDLGADLTILEESHELLERLKGAAPLPMITSCSPGWISFMERFYPHLIPHASTCRSPMTMLSVLAKTYYAEKMGLDPGKMFMVAVMPCVAKKYEAQRPEHRQADGTPYTDAVITTRELAWMINCYGIDLPKLSEGEFDAPLGLSTGAGDIFGTTGGVMEATLRTAAERLTGKPSDRLDFTEVRGVQGVRETYVALGKHQLHVGVANGLSAAKYLLDRVSDTEEPFHILEIMACSGGCCGGGGQPYPPRGFHVLDPALLRLRAQALYDVDRGKSLRRSHENPAVQEIYRNLLGEIGSEKAHQLLHTHYQAQLPRGIK